MSFIVSNSFNLHETINRLRLIKLFQLPMLLAAETALKEQPISTCSRVAVVSLLIHLLNETENIFRSGQKDCVPMLIGRQNSTMQAAA